MQRILQIGCAVLVVLLSACGGGGSDSTSSQQIALQNPCSTIGQNVFVKNTMDDWYLWFDEIPDVDPARFSSPEELLERIRFKKFDRTFSFITTLEEEQQFLGESQFVGFGFGIKLVANDDLRITEVFANSPAAEMGFERGMRILSINGLSVEFLAANGLINQTIGPNVAGLTVVFELRALDGTEFTAAPTKRTVSIPTVSVRNIINVGGTQVGYLVVKNFTDPTFAALNVAFADFVAAGVTEVILDLRYNGGGLVSASNFLANLLAGNIPDGALFQDFQFNSKHTGDNFQFRFSSQANSLNLTRLMVIATQSTASASEGIINGLEPFIDVVVVGDRTFGKPVGQNGFEFCGNILRPVTFRAVNANGDTDYFNGLPPDCNAEDDLTHQLGDVNEASLAEAINVINTGACTVANAKLMRLFAQKAEITVQQPTQANGKTIRLGAY